MFRSYGRRDEKMSAMNLHKEINFIPDFMIYEKNKVKRMITVALVTTVVALAGFSIYFFPDMKMFTLNIQLNNLKVDIKGLEDVREIKNQLEKTENKLNAKKKILDEVSKDEVDVMSLMDKLATAAPENVVMTYLSVSGKNDINVSYSINNPIEATNLANNLRNLNLFQTVEMPAIPIVDQKRDINFALKLK
jgi:Tfp pilus assembly protein PilN